MQGHNKPGKAELRFPVSQVELNPLLSAVTHPVAGLEWIGAGTVQRSRDMLSELFGIDLRSLGVFRIALGSLLLWDLADRSHDTVHEQHGVSVRLQLDQLGYEIRITAIRLDVERDRDRSRYGEIFI